MLCLPAGEGRVDGAAHEPEPGGVEAGGAGVPGLLAQLQVGPANCAVLQRPQVGVQVLHRHRHQLPQQALRDVHLKVGVISQSQEFL